MSRSYGQYCALARALDRVGDRWTMLIVRELLIGPRRYSDLRAALPGVASNLLAGRLRDLEAEGLIARRRVPPPTPATVYELTEHGAGLEEAVLALVRWGGRWMHVRGDDVFEPSWLVLPMRALLRAREPEGVTATWEFEVEGVVMHARIGDGGTETGLGPAGAPDLIIGCDAQTTLMLLAGMLSLAEAEADGRAVVTGDPSARDLFGRVVGESSEAAARVG